MTVEISTKDLESKQNFRDEFCNIVEMTKKKVAIVPKGYVILGQLQTEEEFNKIIHAENWAITQTKDSNILFFDADTNNVDSKLNRFFNRTRTKYVNHSETVKSKHGFLKVTDADHEWCVSFADNFHNKMGIEIYAEKHWVVFGGSYYNDKNIDDPERETTWFPLDDLHKEPIIEVTKAELGLVFGPVTTESKVNTNPSKSTKELLDSDWVDGERYSNGFKLALRRFHQEWSDDDVRNEAYEKNKSLTNPKSLDEVDKWVSDAFNQYQNNKANPQNGYFENKETKNSENIVMLNSKDKGVIDTVSKNIKEKYDFKTLSDTNEILLYNGKIYSKAEAESLIKKETENRIKECTTHDRNEVVNKIKAQTYANLKDFDVDTNLVTLENGILNLETLELSDHSPNYLSRVLLPIEYHKPIFEIHDDTIFEDIEKNLKDTLFWQFLKRSFTIDKVFRNDDFETVLEIIASPIIKRHIDEKAFMFLGSGENGKSVCLDYIKSMIGKDNVSRVTLQQIADNKFMVAQLAGKSANIFTDLESDELKHAGKIKAILSGEGVEAEEKYMSPFTLYPFVKLMFSCNRFPKVYDQSHAFFRRWMIVKWERNFEKDPERIEYLREKLSDNQEEMNKVFSCLVYLARRLNKVGKFTHTKDSKSIQKEWNENADPIDWFDANYIKDSEGNKTKRDTYRFYKKVMLSKGETALGMGQFGKAFAELHDELIINQGRTQRVWLNITFDDVFLEQSDST